MSAQPEQWLDARNLHLAARLGRIRPAIARNGLVREGILRRAIGLTLEATGCEAPLGATCKIEVADGGWVDADELRDEVWDDGGLRGRGVVKAAVHTLRRKLGAPDPIESAPGLGYRIGDGT